MKKTVKNYDLYQYREVFEILEWRNGAVYKTRPTGLHAEVSTKIDAQRYRLAPVSTKLLSQPESELTLIES